MDPHEEEIYAGLAAMLLMAENEGCRPVYWNTREDGRIEIIGNGAEYILKLEEK